MHRLLNPEDPQDVPRAIELLEAIVELQNVPFNSTNPGLVSDLDVLKLFAYMVEAFIRPFIEPTLSLTEQVTLLSRFAHMSFVFFHVHRLKYMSNQLYGDSQTTVKNIMFCIAKQHETNCNEKYFVAEDGDDDLEELFGVSRWFGEHNSAMNFKQGVEQMGWSADVQAVHARWPELHAPHQR